MSVCYDGRVLNRACVWRHEGDNTVHIEAEGWSEAAPPEGAVLEIDRPGGAYQVVVTQALTFRMPGSLWEVWRLTAEERAA